MSTNEQAREQKPDSRQEREHSAEGAVPVRVSAPSWYLMAVKGVLVGLLFIQVCAMIWGTVETARLAIRAIPYGFLDVLKSLIVNSLLVLALLEISRTVVAYFTLGRVKVTFIVDTVLAVFLSEAVVTWFSGESIVRAIELLLILLVLMVLRIVAIQYQPSKRDTLAEPVSSSPALDRLLARIRKKSSTPPGCPEEVD
ncbi:MAG: hypothetical protein ACYCYP_02175 [Leptospirales bacterium]